MHFIYGFKMLSLCSEKLFSLKHFCSLIMHKAWAVSKYYVYESIWNPEGMIISAIRNTDCHLSIILTMEMLCWGDVCRAVCTNSLPPPRHHPYIIPMCRYLPRQQVSSDLPARCWIYGRRVSIVQSPAKPTARWKKSSGKWSSEIYWPNDYY